MVQMLPTKKSKQSSQSEKPTTVNGLLKTITILVLALSFTALIVGGFWIFKNQAPIPSDVVNADGDVLMTSETIKGGQAVFQKYGLMDYGTVLGNGSYMGPDYTAEALKVYTEGMQDFKAEKKYNQIFKDLGSEEKAIIKDQVITKTRENRYNEDEDKIYVSVAHAYGIGQVEDY